MFILTLGLDRSHILPWSCRGHSCPHSWERASYWSVRYSASDSAREVRAKVSKSGLWWRCAGAALTRFSCLQVSCQYPRDEYRSLSIASEMPPDVMKMIRR